MDMVERVARAIYVAYAIEEGSPPDVANADADFHWPFWVGEARAAIAAMREPTEKMVRAGEKEFIASDVACCMEPAEDCWQAMIDAALTSSEKG